jgi:NitT/TauT family transport system ATP-binding protein
MINLKNVWWSPAQVPVLAGLTTSIPKGEFCCIVGPSGAGKTSFLRLVAGLLEPDEGSVLVEGKTPKSSGEKMSYVFQKPVLFPWRTVRENMRLPYEVRGIDVSNKTVSQYLDLVRLPDVGDLFPKALSGGMQSRVAIARALVTEPEIMLMDEPFADLDEINREHLNVELQRIWLEHKRTVLFVTHDLSEAVFLADRIIVLSAKPAKVFAEIIVPLKRPRDEATFDDPVFNETLKEVRHALRLAVRAYPSEPK